jgi:hypothetical protein
MALLWVEGFEKYGETGNSPSTVGAYNVLDTKYNADNVFNIDLVTGRHGGIAAQFDSSSTYLNTPALDTNNQTLICGIAFKVTTFVSGIRVMDFRSAGNFGTSVSFRSLALTALNTGEMNVTREGSSLATSSGANIQDDTWYYVEMKVFAADAGGNVTVHLDGVEIINVTGDTAITWDFYNSVLLRTATTDEAQFDDWYICDGSGAANNDFLGECRVETLTPNSDASGNWTANSGGDLYAMLDDPAVGTTNFIHETVSGNQAVFDSNCLSANAATGTIQGLMVTCDSLQSGNFKKYAKMITQNGSGGTIQDSGVFMPGKSVPIAHTQIMEDDPDGGSWTPNTVNTFRMGVEVS